MILNLTQIIVIALVIIGFSITVYLVVKNLKTQCSGTDEYSSENKRCQPQCDENSDKPIYDPKSNTCMECKPGETKSKDHICGLCTSSQMHCGDKCYDPNTHNCIDNKICLKSEELCGSECYNKDTHKCICLGKDGEEECSDGDIKILCKNSESVCDDKCYDTGKQTCDIDSHTLCDKDKSYNDGTKCCLKHQRPYEDRKCIDCAEELCSGTCCDGKECCNGNCCDNSKGEFCKEGICCKKDEINVNGICCKKGEINAGGICCKKGDINCNGKCCDGKECCGDTCCKEECCGGICCDAKDGVNYSCVNDTCCPTNKVVNDKNGNVMCCHGKDKVISKDGKSCVIGCGDEECDLDNQFCASVVDKDGITQYSCANNKGCSTSAIAYDPILTNNGENIVNKDDVPIPFCKVSIGGVDKYYTVKNSPGVTGALNRDSYYKLEDKECNKGDCLNTIKEKGNIFSQYNEATKKCYTEYDCNKLLPDYKDARDDEKCPITKDGKFSDRCCVDKDGKVTGQVCPEGRFCYNGVCATSYAFDKSQNSKDCSGIYGPEWKGKRYNTIKECRKEEAKNMTINCKSDCNPDYKFEYIRYKSYNKNDRPCKYPIWDKKITGKDELTCWNENIPTICYERSDWTSKNGDFPKEWTEGDMDSWWSHVNYSKGTTYHQSKCKHTNSHTRCNKQPNSKYSGKSNYCFGHKYRSPYCVTKNSIDPFFNWKC